MLCGSILLLLCIMLLDARPGAASDTSLLDTIKNVDEPFDSRSVSQVRPIVQPTVLAREKYQGGPFRVLARKQDIERYKCSSCHTAKEVRGKSAFELTHGNKKGRKIDLDHSYQLCGQCHFRQKRDWLGGAHGKRVSYWAGDRVIYNCTTCHDPHSPKFAKRFPATYSVPLN